MTKRNRIDNELSHIKVDKVEVPCRLEASSAYEKTLTKKKLGPSLSPPLGEVSESVLDVLLEDLIHAPSRQKALRDTITAIHAEGDGTKVVVFAPAGAGFESATEALRSLKLEGQQRSVRLAEEAHFDMT